MGKKFVAVFKEKQKETLTKDLLNSHIDYLKKMENEGKLFICGPFKNNDGALQILISKNIKSARKLVESDPFIRNGYYNSYDIYELIEANENNNWLMTNEQTEGNMQN